MQRADKEWGSTDNTQGILICSKILLSCRLQISHWKHTLCSNCILKITKNVAVLLQFFFYNQQLLSFSQRFQIICKWKPPNTRVECKGTPLWKSWRVWFGLLFFFKVNVFIMLEYQGKRESCDSVLRIPQASRFSWSKEQFLPHGFSWIWTCSASVVCKVPVLKNTPPGLLSSSNPWLLLLLRVFTC